MKGWAAFIPKAIEDVRAGTGYELDESKALLHRPKAIYVTTGACQRAMYGAKVEGVRVVEPYDWDVEAWEQEQRWIEGHFRLKGEMDRLAKFIEKGRAT